MSKTKKQTKQELLIRCPVCGNEYSSNESQTLFNTCLESNPDLIAAAPDLLAACKAANEIMSRSKLNDPKEESEFANAMIGLRQAIASAEGKEL